MLSTWRNANHSTEYGVVDVLSWAGWCNCEACQGFRQEQTGRAVGGSHDEQANESS